MSDRPHRPRRGARGLSDDDHKLWNHVTGSITPLPGRARRLHSKLDQSAGPAEPRGKEAVSSPPSYGRVETKASIPTVSRPASQRSEAPATLNTQPRKVKVAMSVAQFDRRKAKKIGAGRVAIDARLDLHGMFQSEAHAALRAFIVSAVGRGCNTVLIITGKGVSTASAEWSTPNDRGVLRRNVPRWLSEPEFSSLVVSFTEAHVRHGGEGALYVQLRSVRRVTQAD